MSIAWKVAMGVLASCAALLGGCNGGVKAHSVSVELDAELRGSGGGPRQPIEVDVVAVNSQAGLPAWATMDVDEYFDIGKGARESESRRATLYFDPASGRSRLEVGSGDARWAEWKRQNVDTVYLLMGGLPKGGATGTDGRRLQLPLYCGAWEDERIEVRASRNGLRAVNGPKPKE